jgi:predicted NBD/HSP70 family sugar kinase
MVDILRTPAAPGRSARQSTLRATNLSLVLHAVCEAEIPVSRAAVAAKTGMTRSTASRLVDDLVEAGLVEELAPRLSGVGRPAVPLVPARGTVAGLGMQVNAAHVAVRLVDLRGDLVAGSQAEPDLVGSTPEQGMSILAEHVRTVLDQSPAGLRVAGAALALPGLVDARTGTLLKAPNLGWHELDPKPALAELLPGLPVTVANEANTAALSVAEPRPGARGEHADFIYLSGEIGIGAAVVVNHVVNSGPHGWAGELGHLTYDPAGPDCPCGSTGCLERYAGRLSLVERAGLPTGSTLEDVAREAAGGNAAAQAAVDVAAEALGVVLAGAVNLVDVSTVVLGGEIASLTDLVRDTVEAALRRRVLAGPWIDPHVVRAPLDSGAAAQGAAIGRLHGVLESPDAWVNA